MSKYFLDCEFIEDGHTIDPISLALVCVDGREYYAQNAECKLSRAGVWVKGHVFPALQGCPERLEPNACALLHETCVWRNRRTIREDILQFIGDDKPEFWGYYADYDWVVLCQLFGKMIDLPKGWPMWCREIKQLCEDKGDPTLPKQNIGEHNALMDARWNREVYLVLQKLPYTTSEPGPGETPRIS